jgi:hypothetical protein
MGSFESFLARQAFWYSFCLKAYATLSGGTMVDRRTQEEEGSNRKKDPDDWTTGDEPMTGAQRSYMHTLAEEAHEEVRDDLTKAEASKKIDELQEKTGRKPPAT